MIVFYRRTTTSMSLHKMLKGIDEAALLSNPWQPLSLEDIGKQIIKIRSVESNPVHEDYLPLSEEPISNRPDRSYCDQIFTLLDLRVKMVTHYSMDAYLFYINNRNEDAQCPKLLLTDHVGEITGMTVVPIEPHMFMTTKPRELSERYYDGWVLLDEVKEFISQQCLPAK